MNKKKICLWLIIFLVVIFGGVKSSFRGSGSKTVILKPVEFKSIMNYGTIIDGSGLWDNKVVKGGEFEVRILGREYEDEKEECITYKAGGNPLIVFDASSNNIFTHKVCSVKRETTDSKYNNKNSFGFSVRYKVPNDTDELYASVYIEPVYSEVFKIVDKPELEITQTPSSGKVLLGDNVTFNIILKNTGEFISRGTILKDTLNSNFTLVNSSLDYTLKDGSYVFEIPDIEPNNSYSLTITAKVNSDAKTDIALDNKVLVSSDYVNERSKTTSVVAEPLVVKEPRFTIESVASKTKIKQGEEFQYVITVNNTSDVDASLLTIKSIIDSNLEIIDSNGATNSDNTLTWNTSIKSNETKKYIVRVKMKDNVAIGTKVVLQSSVLYNNNLKGNVINNLEVQDTKIDVDIVSDKDSVTCNETINYNIKIQNNNDVIAKNVEVTQEFDDNLIIVKAIGGEVNGNKVTYKIDNINANSEITFVVEVKVKEDAKTDSSLNNKTEVNEDGIKNIITNTDEVVLKPSVDNNKTSNNDNKNVNDIENPQTGVVTLVSLVGLGIILLLLVIKRIRKINNLYKI